MDFFDWHCLTPFQIYEEARSHPGGRAPPPDWEPRDTRSSAPSEPMQTNGSIGGTKRTTQQSKRLSSLQENIDRQSHELIRMQHEQSRQFADICERLDTLKEYIKEIRPLVVPKERRPNSGNEESEPHIEPIESLHSLDNTNSIDVFASSELEASVRPEVRIDNEEESQAVPQTKTLFVNPDIMVCKWGDCNVTFTEKEDFLSHIRSHTATWRCLWGDCGMEITPADVREHWHGKHRTISTEGMVCVWDNCQEGERVLYQDMRKFFDHWAIAHRKNWRTRCPWTQCEQTFLIPSQVTKHCKLTYWRCQKRVKRDEGRLKQRSRKKNRKRKTKPK
jgi:hypothetical protein